MHIFIYTSILWDNDWLCDILSSLSLVSVTLLQEIVSVTPPPPNSAAAGNILEMSPNTATVVVLASNFDDKVQ